MKRLITGLRKTVGIQLVDLNLIMFKLILVKYLSPLKTGALRIESS